jgi:hypothetical protein
MGGPFFECGGMPAGFAFRLQRPIQELATRIQHELVSLSITQEIHKSIR